MAMNIVKISKFLRQAKLQKFTQLLSLTRPVLAPGSKRSSNLCFAYNQTTGISTIRNSLSSVQNVLENLDSSSSTQVGRLERDFQRIDSILKRGGFLHRNIIEKLLNEVNSSKESINSTQALFLLRCCGSTVNLEPPDVRNSLVSKIWKTFENKGLPLDISHYNALLLVFLENENKFPPLDFLSTIESKGIQPNRITYTRLIARYCQDGDIEGANKILEFMKEKNLPIGEHIFNQLIIGNSRANDLDASKNVVEVMKQSGITPNSETYSTLLQAHAEHGDVSGFKELLEQCEKDGIIISDKSAMDLVCVLARKELRQHVSELLSKIPKREGYDTLVTYACNRLLQDGQDEVAFEVFQTLNFAEDRHYTKGFFPKQLAASNLDLYKVVNYCEEIKQKQWNVLSYELALESYIFQGKFDMALGLIRVMKEKEVPVRGHYFYPLFSNLRNSGDKEKIFDLLEEMFAMEVEFDQELISDFVMPALNVSKSVDDVSDVYVRLSNYQGEMNLSQLYNGVVLFLIRNGSLDLAAGFVNRFKRGVQWSCRPALCDEFLKTGNAEDTACILRQMLPISLRLNKELSEDSDGGFYGIKDFLGLTISKLNKSGNDDDGKLIRLFQSMEEEGVALPAVMGDRLKKQFGTSLSEEVCQWLDRLSNVEDVTSNLRAPSRGAPNERRNVMNESNLREKIAESESKGEDDTDLQRMLLISLIRQHKLTEAEELFNKLRSNGVNITVGAQVLLLDLYIEQQKFEEAESFLNSIMDQNESIQLTSHKVVKWANVLVQQGRFQDASKFLLMNSPESGDWAPEFQPDLADGAYRNRVRNLLMRIVDHKDVDSLKLIQEALLSRGFSTPSVVMPALIKFYVEEGNLDEAMVQFEKIAEEHKITAAKDALTVACIEKEDSEKIQKIIDISFEVHGEMNSLYDLVFSFLELNKIDQARKVFETNGLRTLQNRLNDRCQFYLQRERLQELEGLVAVTKGLFSINRPVMFEYLLKGMILKDSPEEALGVWTSMQEEGVEPSPLFLSTLGKYLQSKGLEVPFVFSEPPRTRTPIVASPPRSSERKVAVKTEVSPHDALIRALDARNIDQIKSEWDRIQETGINLPPRLHSRLIGSLLHFDHVTEALEEVKSLLAQGNRPSVANLRMLLPKLSEAGDVTSIQFLGKYMDERKRRAAFYNTNLFEAHLKAERVEEFLSRVSNNDGEFVLTAGALFSLMEKRPELYPQLVKCAESQKENGKTNLYTYLWGSLFNQGKMEEAEKIYNDVLKDRDSFEISKLCTACFLEKNTAKLDSLMDVLNRKPDGRENIKGYAYSTHLDILVSQEKYDEALTTTNKALESISLEHFRRNTLVNMKASMEKKGLAFPHAIPDQENTTKSSSSSSSSSDEDVKK